MQAGEMRFELTLLSIEETPKNLKNNIFELEFWEKPVWQASQDYPLWWESRMQMFRGIDWSKIHLLSYQTLLEPELGVCQGWSDSWDSVHSYFYFGLFLKQRNSASNINEAAGSLMPSSFVSSGGVPKVWCILRAHTKWDVPRSKA